MAPRGEDATLFAKSAWRLIPFLGLLYIVNYLDRVNAGFAALTMNADLGFSPAVFGFGAGVLFAGYLLFQVPANAILARLGARRWMFLYPDGVGRDFRRHGIRPQSRQSFMSCGFCSGLPRPGFFRA